MEYARYSMAYSLDVCLRAAIVQTGNATRSAGQCRFDGLVPKVCVSLRAVCGLWEWYDFFFQLFLFLPLSSPPRIHHILLRETRTHPHSFLSKLLTMTSRNDDDQRDPINRPGENPVDGKEHLHGQDSNSSTGSTANTELSNNSTALDMNRRSSTEADPKDEMHVNDAHQESPADSISFATPSETTSEAKQSTPMPILERRKSSMAVVGSRPKTPASAEKHVTIVDATEELAINVEDASKQEDAAVSEDRTKDEENTKQELAKILMQFDPLVDLKQGNDDGYLAPESIQPTTDLSSSAQVLSTSPDLSLSSSSSPETPQQLDSPRTSHDVQVAMSEKARSSTKKKSESRHKSPLSPQGNNTGADISSSSRSEPPKPKEIPFDFHKFLEQMRHRSAIPITRFFQSFLKEFDKKPWTVNEQIKIIHDFLDFITGKMELCELWKNATDQEFENVKEGMEKLVMNRLFAYTFSPSTTDDAERDEVLSQKIRIFRWIKEEHLDIPHSPHNEAYLNNAQAELKKINSYKAPRDKVICILNCCKFIFTLIRRSEGNSKGADTFLPILIYVVLRSNPPNLVSNVQYISRFRNPDKLQAEAGYYLASLMGAISFIENLEASSLSISLAEFDQQIGKTMAELSQERADAMAAAEAAGTLSASTLLGPGSSTSAGGPRKQESRLAVLVAGTAATRSTRQQPSMDEKKYLASEPDYHHERQERSLQQQRLQQQQMQGSRTGQEFQSGPSQTRISPSPSGTSLMNPAAALIERGANFATKTMQKPLDLIERMFQDNGDEEDMARPYPPRPIPQYQQQQQASMQRPEPPQRDDSFTEFVYVPAGQQLQQSSLQQPREFYQQQQQQEYPGNVQRARQRTVSGTQQPQQAQVQHLNQQPQQQSAEDYLQALETLADMFPTCERQVCDVILQANDGRLSPSIDTLLEISSANDNKVQQASTEVTDAQSEGTKEGQDDGRL
ncbi:hypothetical protein KVV02_005329 [Mortierella alpina]|uniref:Guanine nucleotide exchange factor Vps9 n=1 Tax=Mortierella alpina TaxID=64518 RepID=A0A9P7ZW43_MORAP|nr:hypothetical protein KVV02_005329 [Mortierella alpina]